MLTKQMVADYYVVDIRTISRYIESNQEELEYNGYLLCKGKSMIDFKLRLVKDIDVPKNGCWFVTHIFSNPRDRLYL